MTRITLKSLRAALLTLLLAPLVSGQSDRGAILRRQRRRRFANHTLGNAPRYNGLARLQANLRENASLQKIFNFTERFRLEFRWEVFNVFNRVVLGAPDSGITSTSFGRVTSAQSPRQMQFGLKLYF